MDELFEILRIERPQAANVILYANVNLRLASKLHLYFIPCDHECAETCRLGNHTSLPVSQLSDIIT